MAQDPSTGPIPRAEFAAICGAPFGEAAKRIRKYDPMWGRAPGEKIEWKVECSGTMYGTAYVKASSKEEAEKEAENLTSGDVDWDDGNDDFNIDKIEPVIK